MKHLRGKIFLNSKYEFDYDNWHYSGYYLFDSLWARINGVWQYILALFDVKLNTLVSTKLVKSEDSKTICVCACYSFLFSGSSRWSKNQIPGTSLVVWWLRICLVMQGTQVGSLVRELRSHMLQGNSVHANYWACMPELKRSPGCRNSNKKIPCHS